MQLPLVIINFKTYDSAYGEKAVELAKVCEKVARETNTHIAVAVGAADIYRISEAVSIPVVAQHIDYHPPGSHTGFILPEDIKEEGACATLLNHSERRLNMGVLEKSIERAKTSNLIVIACAKDAVEAKKIAEFGPHFVAVEPPELIGGDVSVTEEDPEIIHDAVENVNFVNSNVKLIVGAGIKHRTDVNTALRLGAKGILIASGITKAEDPYKTLFQLVKGL